VTITQGVQETAGSGADSPDAEALQRLLSGRHSCRAYLQDPVPRPIVDRILELAARTPSWCNTQPWDLVITAGAATERFRSALSAHARLGEAVTDFPFPDAYEGEYLQRRRETAWQLYNSVGIAKGDRAASAAQTAKNFEFFGAPHVAIVTSEAALGVYGAIDCGLYVNNFLLAAQALGVGAIPQAALAMHAPFIRKFFGLPTNRRIVCGISFGWPDREDPVNRFRTSRRRAEQTATWVS
jgi:nitroreductase